ncbi:MAG TPA: hypothetical protein VIV60_31675 [Polyangiaceae bacterium]
MALEEVGGAQRRRVEATKYEAPTGILLAVAWGYFAQSAATEALETMNHLSARLYGIARR